MAKVVQDIVYEEHPVGVRHSQADLTDSGQLDLKFPNRIKIWNVGMGWNPEYLDMTEGLVIDMRFENGQWIYTVDPFDKRMEVFKTNNFVVS
jgi:hypothetical protein